MEVPFFPLSNRSGLVCHLLEDWEIISSDHIFERHCFPFCSVVFPHKQWECICGPKVTVTAGTERKQPWLQLLQFLVECHLQTDIELNYVPEPCAKCITGFISFNPHHTKYILLPLWCPIHRWHNWSLAWVIYIRLHVVRNLESALKPKSIYIQNPCLTTVVLGS